MWFYDQTQRKCNQFAYNGCGGTANRFTSRKACVSTCVSSSLSGSCPRGMTPLIEDGDSVVKACTLNVMSTCPPSASCVRSTTNQPICCQTVTSCPDNRTPYVIPGSTSVVACNADADDCPGGNACVESSSVPGFHMCCSTTGSVSRRPPSGFGSARKEPNTLAALIKSISPCPAQLTSNGQTCTVNAIGDCPRNYLCFRDAGYEHGSCCRTGPPKCSMKQYVPIFVSGTQVQICQTDLGGCPRDSRCMTSNIPKVSICCQLYGPRSITSSGGNNIMARPLAQPKCKNGNQPFTSGGDVQACNFEHSDCPAGYKYANMS
ncbi:Kunitz/Bovine pancreatic trypsin inhibitor domain protein [Teladorsagia circumcincta]|uniref:Kunitz/Bovine pancreatic trypsin inhibitor domain protein n=2 Tax=Teladorsagia circumcincta TaxID=45464 RepID=A0A2G9U5I1_TELCI|nr:Kunitz/Bovine pancreatic trypsin inhibitor domain protein [Teladorsagia circumcincta]